MTTLVGELRKVQAARMRVRVFYAEKDIQRTMSLEADVRLEDRDQKRANQWDIVISATTGTIAGSRDRCMKDINQREFETVDIYDFRHLEIEIPYQELKKFIAGLEHD